MILHTVAVCVGGVSLVLVLLLVLTANQLSWIKSARQTHGSVKAVHLNKVPDKHVQPSLVPKMSAMVAGIAKRGWFVPQS